MKNGKKYQKIDFRLEAVPETYKTVVYLYGDIVDERPTNWWTGEEEEGDYITPKEVREIFKDIDNDDIELHINSYGGSIFASVSIFNYLKSLNKNITTVNDGLCASGASLIFMAGNKRIMPKNTVLMIHRASSFCWGNCNELRTVADTLEKLDNSTVFETYNASFKGTEEDLKTLIDSESWISATEALNYGLCDEVKEIVEPKEEPKANINEQEITNGINIMRKFANLKIKGEKIQ